MIKAIVQTVKNLIGLFKYEKIDGVCFICGDPSETLDTSKCMDCKYT